jgi:DNA-binding response OmpR family regulator
MIVLISSSARERTALGALWEGQGWVVFSCEHLFSVRRLLARSLPRVVVTRHTLIDGFSDELIAELAAPAAGPVPRIIVLCAAGTTPATEARQLQLGADCVLRDPIRTEVLLAYINRYLSSPCSAPTGGAAPPAPTLRFADATLHLTDRTLRNSRAAVVLTPREVELVEVLVRCAGQVVSYDLLYSEILGRRFRGDTSNLRVLLGKLAATTRTLGLEVRNWVEVIPKNGYRYTLTPRK